MRIRGVNIQKFTCRLYTVDLKPQEAESWRYNASGSSLGGLRPRAARVATGVSQEALALSADVDRTFVSQIERGIRQPTLTTLCKLARALDVQPSTLVSRMERLLR
jgi:DNA-binding XRE family transcriptional regulator